MLCSGFKAGWYTDAGKLVCLLRASEGTFFLGDGPKTNVP